MNVSDISYIDPSSLLNSMSDSVIALGKDNKILFVNHAAEQFFGAGALILNGELLKHLIPSDAPIISMIEQCRKSGASVSESNVYLESPRIGSHEVNIKANVLLKNSSIVILTIQERSIVHQIDRQMTQRGAVRSVTAMAAMLAHEVKNPLSGIRGAAQLLEEVVGGENVQLTKLICDETDRIVNLVNRMDPFTNNLPVERSAINIHEILDHVLTLAKNGFAKHLRLTEVYDPSLPAVYGNRDQLIQVFLNLIKNAAEAAPISGGEIQLSTRFRHGTRLALSSGKGHVDLPLEVSVRDNGEGIPDDIKPSLFDPFVTTKKNGTGLGLALVAKIIDDHGGMIDLKSAFRRTEFLVLLPKLPNK